MHACVREREKETERERSREVARGEYRGGHFGERERAGGRFEATGS